MIKAYSIYTSEVDDANVASEDIRNQLASIPLCKNSVGIIACHYDFINTGILNVIQEILPFPSMGFTTFYQKTDKIQGLIELTITVLTGDNVDFVVAHDISDAAIESPEDSIKNTYADALKKCSGDPVCTFNFLSVNRPVSGDKFIRIMDSASGGVPCFGGITTSDNEMNQNMFVISDKEIFSYGFTMLLIAGDVEAQFHYVNYDESSFIDMPGTVTKSKDESIIDINNEPVSEFLKDRGLDINKDTVDALLTIPFLFKRDSSSPYIARIAYNVDDNNALQMFGEVPEDAIFRVGTSTPDEMIDDSENLLKKAISDMPDASAFFIFSCIGRYIALGMNEGTEYENFNSIIPENKSYLAGYVGGEICPIINSDNVINEFHNGSLIICALK